MKRLILSLLVLLMIGSVSYGQNYKKITSENKETYVKLWSEILKSEKENRRYGEPKTKIEFVEKKLADLKEAKKWIPRLNDHHEFGFVEKVRILEVVDESTIRCDVLVDRLSSVRRMVHPSSAIETVELTVLIKGVDTKDMKPSNESVIFNKLVEFEKLKDAKVTTDPRSLGQVGFAIEKTKPTIAVFKVHPKFLVSVK